MEELLSLKWNNHRSTFLHILGVLRDKQSYTDVTLACDGKFYSVHKLVLSTCSDYFCAMFEKTSCKSPVIVLKDIKSEDLEALLDYMYLGEVNVRQSDLASLIKAAENLRIKGLAVPDDEPPPKRGSGGGSSSVGAPSRRDSSPPAKRKRRDESEDGREDVRPGGDLHTPPPAPPSSRPKSPGIQRLSPSPHRTAQESHATEERDNRPHSSPAETSSTPHSQAQVSQPAQQLSDPSSQTMSNQYRGDNPPFVKVEVTDEETDGANRESYDLSSESFKEESDVGGEIGNDLPEFLQQAASSALAGTSASYHQSFAGPSGFQPEVSSWHGDGQSMPGNFPGMTFPTNTSQENPPGMPPRGNSQPQLRLSTSEVAIARALLNIPKQATNFSRSTDASQSQPDASSDCASKSPPSQSSSTLLTKRCEGPTSPSLTLSISPLVSPPPAVARIKFSSCPECGKIFRGDYHKYNLKKHLTIHAGLRPYQCPLCQAAFNQKVSMRRHLAFVHRDVEALQSSAH